MSEKEPQFLYRFRSTKKLIEFQELENQEIYFAAPEDLNDPMEGMYDVFWKGDEIVWNNLVKNYLRCLYKAVCMFFVSGQRSTLDNNHIFLSLHALPHILPHCLEKPYQEFLLQFFECDKLRNYINSLVSCQKTVRKDELLCFLTSLHYHALYSIFTIFEKDDPEIIPQEFLKISSNLSSLFDTAITNKSLDEGDFKLKYIQEKLYSILLKLIHRRNNETMWNQTNVQLIFLNFPEEFIRQLNKLMHYGWYTACFSADFKSASMWGYYGDNHKGICLEFKVQTDNNNEQIIKLNRSNHITDGSYSERSRGIPFKFYKVQYNSKFTEIDFFRSIGRFSGDVIDKIWYKDEDNNQSSCTTYRNGDQTLWERHWDEFYIVRTSKLTTWNHENEYRLILTELSGNGDKNSRKLKYNFSDLEGVIFGIDTSIEDKIAIMKIIKQRCKAEKRTDFKFYQAHYSLITGQIEAEELNLIKFKNRVSISETS